MILGALGLAVRLTYLLVWKHPFAVGGDAYWYHYGANLLATGHGFIDAYRYHNHVIAQTADHPPLTILFLAAASVLQAKSFFWHQLEMCALGAGTVVVIAATARQVAGRAAGIIAGVAAAVYPYLWLNDAEVMSETVVQFTTAVAVLAAYQWWKKPSAKRAGFLGLTLGLCALARAEAVLFVPLLAAPLILLDRRHEWRERLRQVVIAAVVAGAVLTPWVTFNLIRFEQPVTISTGFDPTVAVSNCNATYYGSIIGYWSQPCILAYPAPTHGDVSTQEAYYRKLAFKYIDAHRSRLPVVVAARIGRTWGLFRPDQQIHLDQIEGKELYFGAAGLAMYYVLAIGTIAGLWLMRRRRMPLSPILATAATVTFATAITFGQTRYRAAAEPVLILAAAIAAAALWDQLRHRYGEHRAARAEPVATSSAPPAAEPATIGAVTRATPVKRTGKFPCFDGLRAIAAVSVIFVHTSFPSGLTTRHPLIGNFTFAPRDRGGRVLRDLGVPAVPAVRRRPPGRASGAGRPSVREAAAAAHRACLLAGTRRRRVGVALPEATGRQRRRCRRVLQLPADLLPPLHPGGHQRGVDAVRRDVVLRLPARLRRGAGGGAAAAAADAGGRARRPLRDQPGVEARHLRPPGDPADGGGDVAAGQPRSVRPRHGPRRGQRVVATSATPNRRGSRAPGFPRPRGRPRWAASCW